MTTRLVPEEALEASDGEVRRLIASGGPPYALDIDDPAYGRAFRRFLLLSCWPRLLAKIVPDLDEATVFYSKYYWFLILTRLYASAYGPDAGLEQQAFQMLEGADIEVDWSIIEWIEGGVGMEVGDLGPSQHQGDGADCTDEA